MRPKLKGCPVAFTPYMSSFSQNLKVHLFQSSSLSPTPKHSKDLSRPSSGNCRILRDGALIGLHICDPALEAPTPPS